jgi:hypothetical protein
MAPTGPGIGPGRPIVRLSGPPARKPQSTAQKVFLVSVAMVYFAYGTMRTFQFLSGGEPLLVLGSGILLLFAGFLALFHLR